MNLADNLRSASGGIAANKLRSLLTMLGILIGVSAVIILVAVGNGSSRAVQEQIKALGPNTITVISRGRFGRGPASTGTQVQAATITTADVAQLQDPTTAPDVASVAPVLSASETAAYGDASTSVTVTGTTAAYLTAEGYTVESGQSLTADDVTQHQAVVVIGQTLASDLFEPGQNPLGQEIQFGSAQFRVVGLLASKGSSSSGTDLDDVALVPYTAAEDQLTGYTSFNELVVDSRSTSDLDAAEQETADVLASANQTTVADLPFSIVNQASVLQTSQSADHTFTVLLGAVAAISLLVGGIGVMNIMLVTVTERTREIGIRKAVGAPRSAIVAQFLGEAVLLSLLGGVGGVVVGLVGSRFRIVGVQPSVTPASIVEAFVVAVAVGIFFGLYPANRAASLRPIDALRYE